MQLTILNAYAQKAKRVLEPFEKPPSQTYPLQVAELSVEKHELEQALAAARAEADALLEPASRARDAEAALREVAQRLAALGAENDALREELKAAEEAVVQQEGLLEEREATLQELHQEKQVRRAAGVLVAVGRKAARGWPQGARQMILQH